MNDFERESFESEVRKKYPRVGFEKYSDPISAAEFGREVGDYRTPFVRDLWAGFMLAESARQGGEVGPVAWLVENAFTGSETLYRTEAQAKAHRCIAVEIDENDSAKRITPLYTHPPAPAQGVPDTVYWHFEGSDQDNLETLHPSVQVIISAGTLQGLLCGAAPTQGLPENDDLVADYALCLDALGCKLEVGEEIPVCLGDMLDEMLSATPQPEAGAQWVIQLRGEYLATRGIWERADHRGYTNDIHEAGRYSEAEAKKSEAMAPEKYKAVCLTRPQPPKEQGE